jgi:hypothetical protein
MSIPNDLTEEERGMFAEHGVTFDDEGGAPENTTPDAPESVAAPTVETITVPVARDPATGQFAAPPATPAATSTQGEIDPATGQVKTPDPAAAPPPGFVPHAALHAERVKAQEIARNFATLQARTNAILAAQAKATTSAHPMPDIETDPAGFVQALRDRLDAFENKEREANMTRSVDSAIEQDEKTYESYTPDYPHASRYYVGSRARELLLTQTPEAAQQIMAQEVRQIADMAWKKGVPAASMIRDIAIARGYQPGTEVPDINFAALQASPPQPQAQTPTPPATPAQQRGKPTAQQILASVEQGRATSKTLSSGGGAGGAVDLNAEALLSMSDEEFEHHLQLGTRNGSARFAAIGGR